MKIKCPHCHFEYELSTEEKVNRTLSQNGLYWVWMTIIGNFLGYTKEEMHYVFKRQFLSDRMPILSDDEFTEYLKKLNYKEVSTTKLSTEEMTQYLNNISNQAIELQLTLPTEDTI